METEDVLKLRGQSWLGALLTAIGLTLFGSALFCLAVQFQHNLGVHFFDVPAGVDNPLLLAVPLFTMTGISCALVGLSTLAAVRNLRRVRSHGLRGTARVIATKPTAVEVNGVRLLEVDVIAPLHRTDRALACILVL